MGDYGQYIVPETKDMVNFKIGQPALSMLPLDLIRDSAAVKFEETDPMFLQYGHIMGYPKFRATLAEFLTAGYHSRVDPDRLFITNGITGGLALVCSLFVESGDLVFLEEPSYFLALGIMHDFRLTVRQIPMEADGLNLDVLETEFLQRGKIPKFLYTIPTCHNPTGRTMSFAKRQRLVELSIAYEFLIIADEVYQLLSFPHVEPPPPMFNFDTSGTVLALGSFSKILAPALRLGWIQACPELLSKFINSGQLDSSGGISPVISGIVHSAILLGHQQRHLDWTKETLWNRARVLMAELDRVLPENVSYEKPDGGYFILVQLPEYMSASELLELASTKHKVQFLPGSSFAKSMQNYCRLSFSWYNDEDLVIGAQRFAAAIVEYEHKCVINMGKPEVISTAAPCSISVAIHGSTGRLGSLIVQEMQNSDNPCHFNGALDCRKSPAIQLPERTQVLMDVSSATGLRALLEALILANIKMPLVIGTTGSKLEFPFRLVQKYATEAPVVIQSNFSTGVPILTELVRRTASSLSRQGLSQWNCAIHEMHHVAKKKVDAPSETAKSLAAAVRGVSEFDSVDMTSNRVGDEMGHHRVIFAGPGERLELIHQVTRQNVFALGALRTVEWIVTQPKGLVVL